jgi:ATP-binding cassette subfamily B (MDR/TAP) protein 1
MSFFQPLMSLLFGNLTEQFVNFASILAMANAGTPGYSEKIPAAAAEFRRSAGKSASELVYIGPFYISRMLF